MNLASLARLEAPGNEAARRKFERLRDAADHAMNGSPAHLEYARWHDAWAAGDHERLQSEAEADEAAQQSASPGPEAA